MGEKVISTTASLCPECLELIPAKIIESNGKILYRKECKKHGSFEDIYYGDSKLYFKAKRFAREGKGIQNPEVRKENPVCPKDCGLCRLHKSHTALANLVATNRCDLSCWYCFFYAEKAGYVYEPSIQEIKKMLLPIKNEKPIGGNAVQITGGEPCLRKDLPEIVKTAKEIGFDHVQLNTNGIRLSHDLEFAKKLEQAGVNTLYLSFDGVSTKTNPKNHWEIPKALENCRKAGIGVVLVPTVINSVNDHELGKIVSFAFNRLDVVRGINFQPVSLVGKMPKKERERYRITIPDALKRIEEQTNGELAVEDFYPVPCVMPLSEFVELLTGKPQYDLSTHFACGMATYVFKEKGKMLPITRFVDFEGLHEYLSGQVEEMKKGKTKARVIAESLLKLGSFIDKKKQPADLKLSRILADIITKHDYSALGAFHNKSMYIGMMHFQDLYNWDIERIKRCSIHYATPEGTIPFCTFNVIPQWYRDKIQRKHSESIPEWEKRVGRKMAADFYTRTGTENHKCGAECSI